MLLYMFQHYIRRMSFSSQYPGFAMTIQRQIEVNVLCIFLEPCICVCLHCDFQDHFLSLEEEEACGFFIQCNGALRSNPSYIETEGYFITCTVSIILLCSIVI